MFLSMLLAVCMFQTPAFANELLGAGATFPYPYYSKLFDTYHKSKRGSRQIIRPLGRVVVYGSFWKRRLILAALMLLWKKKPEKAEGDILHIPTCLGAVVVSYNLPGDLTLKLTPEIISEIFLGKIKKWNWYKN